VEGLGGRIRSARERLGISRESLAERLDLSYWALAKYEAGDRTPSPEVLAKLATELGVTTDYLLGRAEEPELPEDVQVWLRHASDLTPEQRQRLREYIEFLKFEHRRKGIGSRSNGREE